MVAAVSRDATVSERGREERGVDMKDNMIAGKNIGGCLICGEPLVYNDTSKEMRCEACGKTFETNVCCTRGHYICDDCHAAPAESTVRTIAANAASTDAIEIANQMMMAQGIHMHGPEHHFLVGAALFAAYYNATRHATNNTANNDTNHGINHTTNNATNHGISHTTNHDINFDTALNAIIARGKMVPGGFCGLAGCCGAAVSAGIFYSVIKKTTPLSKDPWSVGMSLTASCLNAISKYGGPRCCKRDTFSSIIAAVEFLKENDGVIISNNNISSNNMSSNDKVICQFSKENHECLKEACPFYPQIDE